MMYSVSFVNQKRAELMILNEQVLFAYRFDDEKKETVDIIEVDVAKDLFCRFGRPASQQTSKFVFCTRPRIVSCSKISIRG